MTTENIKQYIPKGAKTKIYDNTVVFEIPTSSIKEIADDFCNKKNFSLKLITATDERKEHGCFKIWYIFGIPKQNIFIVPFVALKNTNEFPSLTPVIHEALNYERKIKTFFGLVPISHPDPRSMILHENWPADVFPLRKDFDWQTRPEKADNKPFQFQKVTGEGIYEIPVGPIHAGIIEPGHFRFSVAGEEIVLLEPRLGFTHKGSEKLFERLPIDEKIRLSEKISGDSSFSHSLAFCDALERLGGYVPPRRARYLRTIYAELERLANHIGDIGAIMLDTGFNFGGAHGSRLREMIMRINERITGNRFLRGVNVVGGVSKDISDEEKVALARDLSNITKDFSEVIEVAENSISLLNRLKDTGILTYEVAKINGIVGIAAKAAGIENDARIDFPYAAYDELKINNVVVEKDGDVYARFLVRVKEALESFETIQCALRQLPKGPINIPINTIVLEKNASIVSIVEGWRGEIVYFVTTDGYGNINRVAPRDPSFLNWAAIGTVGFGNVVPDFPLINKSFNLSYSGNDL